MNNRLFPKSLVFALSLLLAFSVALSSQANAQDAIVSVISTQVDPDPVNPIQVGVPIWLVNTIQINAASLGFYYDRDNPAIDPYVVIDSVTLTGGTAEHTFPKVSANDTTHLGVLGFLYYPDIPTIEPVVPGDSLLGTLWFTVSAGAPDLIIPIDSGWFPPAGDFVLTDQDANSVHPAFNAGTLTIGSPAAADLDVTPDTLTFNATEGGSNPAAQSFNIANVGSGTLDWTASEIAAWFDLSAYSGTAPSTVDVSVNIAGLSAGTHVETVTVDGGSAANSPQNVTIILVLAPPPPVIALSQTVFDFEATEGEKANLYDTLTITNAGGGTLEWAAAKTQAWLTLDPTSGTAPSDMELLVNTTGLGVGLHKDSIAISDPDATNSPQKVYVNLTINAPPPEIGLSQALFTFEATEGEKANLYDTLTITNTGGGTLNWTGANAEAWLTIDPTSGAAPSDVELAVATAGLTVGIYYDTVTISAAGATNTPQKAAVQLTINEPDPEISVDPSAFTFDVLVGDDPADKLMNISNAGGGTLNFSLSNLEGWLTVAPGSGAAPAVCTLSVVSNALSVGTYYDTITVSAPGATNTPVQVPVTLNVLDLDPVIVLNPTSFNIELYEGGFATFDTLNITNGGGGTLNWSAGNLQSWLTLDPTSGTAPSAVELYLLSTGLAVGTYYDTITVTAVGVANSPQTVEVVLDVVESPQFVIKLGDDPVTQLVFEGETAKSLDPQTINVGSTSDPIYWEATYNSAWLEVDPGDGVTPTDVDVSVDISGLAAGTYYDTITFGLLKSTDDFELEVVLILTEPQAEFAVDPTSITFNTDEVVNPAPQDLDISSTGTELDWGAVYSSGWLGLSSATGITPSTIGVSADVTGLGAGTYYDTIVINEQPGKAAATVYVPVTLNISAVEQPVLSVSPLTFNFEGTEGGSSLPSQSLSIVNLASGTLNWSASYDAGWLLLSQNSGVGNATVDVMVDISGLIADSYIDTITVFDNAAENSPQYVEVNLLVNPASSQGGDTVWVACDTTLTGQTAEVEITFTNDNIIAGIQIPLNFDQTLVSCDSVSFAGSRVEYVSTLMATIDNIGGTVNIGVIPTEEELVPVGDGLLATMYFTGLMAGYTDIDTGFIAPASEYVFVDEYTQEFFPEFDAGCVMVEEPSEPCIEVSATEFFFEGVEGEMDPADQFLTITNCGSGALSWTASNNEAWLTPNPTSGTDDDVITLSVSLAGLTVDDYYDTLTITDAAASNSPVNVIVHLAVNEAGPPMDTVRIVSTTVVPSPTVDVSFGMRIELFNMEQINAASLGFYYGRYNPAIEPYLVIDSVTLTGGGAEHTFPKVSANDTAHLGVLGFLYYPDIPGVYPVPPGDSLLGTLWFTVSAGTPDMVVPVDSGWFPPAGDFVLTDADANSVIPYLKPGDIIIASAPPEVELVVEPDTLFFTGQLGSPNPDPQTFDITALPFGKVLLDWTAAFDAPWLSMDPMSGTAPSEPEVSVDLTGLVATTYYETIVITAEEANNSPQEIVVMFDVLPESAEGLSGTVVDADGLAPIEAATVDVFDTFGGTLAATTMTNASGEFEFATLPAGDYYARAYKNGYYPDDLDVTCPDDGVEFVLTATDDILPTYEWVNFYCNENMLNDELIQVGDVIEAYNPEGFLCGQFFVDEAGQYGFMPVYRDDDFTPEKDGCYPGDPISFTINGYTAETSDDATWTSNGDNVQICLNAYTEYTRCIELEAGWNLISWNVDTGDDDIETLIADIKGDIDVILGFEAGALTYDPDPDMSEFNTLTEMDHFHGYWFRMNNPATFCLTGMKVPAATPIALEMGWNLASYLPEDEDEIEHALASIMDYLLVVLGYDGGGLSYQPDLKDFSTLDTLRPDFGYWIKVDDDVMLTYPGDAPPPAFAKMIPDMFATDRSEVATSNVWINLYGRDVAVDGEPVCAGTRLEAYDTDGILCGTFTVTESGKFGFMPVYGAENGSNVGLQRGDQFSIRVNGQETEETFTFSGGGDRIAVGSLSLKSGGINPIPERYNLAQNYPNPFNPTTTVAYDIPVEAKVKLTIYNILGEKVATLVDESKPAGSYTAEWNGQTDNGSAVSSGIYFYRLTAGDYVKSMKMTLMK